MYYWYDANERVNLRAIIFLVSKEKFQHLFANQCQSA